jgi:hypothetical protein
MTADQIITIVASVLGGAVGGVAAIAAYMHGYLNTERTERRKQKIDLVQELMATLTNDVLTLAVAAARKGGT